MNKLRKIILLGAASMMAIILGSCDDEANYDEDINIVFTTDVHCGIEDNIGYSSLSAYKNDLLKKNKYVTMVDAGDSVQGDFVGAVSKGSYIVDIMNTVGYDIWNLGNHEFDFGMDTLSQLVDSFNGNVLSCNLKYNGSNENKISNIKPYSIIEYGERSVGYVGVTTPHSITESNPKSFMENGEIVFSFNNETSESFYNCIQNNIDECKNKGADYVVLVTHLGIGDEYSPWQVSDVINNTRGVTAVIDGHGHKDISASYEKDLDDNLVPFCEAGTKLKEFGHLNITSKGNVNIGFIQKYENKDPNVDSIINDIKLKLDEIGNEVIANSNVELKIRDEEGIRLVRSRETAIGNMIADAYKYVGETEIAFVNGGGIRADLPSGDIKFKDVKAVHPFGNYICSVKALGQNIADYLEFTSKDVKSIYKDSSGPVGENGAFANVSGLKYTVDTSIESHVLIDNLGNFKGVDGQRRVKNILVYNGTSYEALDLNRTYTVAANDFLLIGGGDGANMFLDCEVIQTGEFYDYQGLAKYIKEYLNGDVATKYSSIEGRITIE